MNASTVTPLAPTKGPRSRMKIVAGIAIAALVVLTAFAIVPGMALGPQSTESNLPGELNTTEHSESYIVFKDGNSVLAKNGTTGIIDYMSTNASAVIQYALDAGRYVYIKDGTYVLNWNINITHSNTLLSGSGAATILYLNSGYSVVSKNPWQPATIGVVSSKISNVTLRDFAIDGNKAGQSKGSAAIQFYHAYNCLVENVYIHDMYGGNAISLQDTHDTSISGCTIKDIGTATSWGGGIATGSRYAGTVCSNITIESNWISGSTNSGIDIEPGRDISITGNTIADMATWSTTRGAGIYISSVTNFPESERITIALNRISGTAGNGIIAYGTEHLVISDNTILSCGQSGIYACRCPDFTINGNDVSFNCFAGIETFESANGIISSNYCENNSAGSSSAGNIVVQSDTTIPAIDITIMNNRCIGAYRGLSCTGDDCDYIIALGNILTGYSGVNYVNGAHSIKANNIGV